MKTMRKFEKIPADVFVDGKVDFDKRIVTASDGRMWTDVIVSRRKIEWLADDEERVDLQAFGLRVSAVEQLRNLKRALWN